MTKTNKATSIKLRTETYDQIRFLSDKSGLSKTQLVAEIFDAIFNVGCTYESLNFEYLFDISRTQVTVALSGKNNLHVKEFKHPEASKEAKEKVILKFKCKDENSWKTHAERMAQKKVN